jgi:hypothetical protein
MIQFTKPAQLNGSQLRDELRAAGVKITDDNQAVSTDGEQNLWLEIADADKTKAQEVVANHVGIDKEATFEDKLSSVGLSLTDLKAALGL